MDLAFVEYKDPKGAKDVSHNIGYKLIHSRTFEVSRNN